MEKRLAERLNSLKEEFTKGQQRLNELENESTQLRNTLLRISGAIQVLEEELNQTDSSNGLAQSMTAHQNENT